MKRYGIDFDKCLYMGNRLYIVYLILIIYGHTLNVLVVPPSQPTPSLKLKLLAFHCDSLQFEVRSA